MLLRRFGAAGCANALPVGDIDKQITGLLNFDRAPFSALLGVCLRCRYDRIVLTGTRVAHFAALPASRRLTSAGRPAYWIETAELVRRPKLMSGRTLVIVACPSGTCEHIAGLSRRCTDAHDQTTIIAITEDIGSPLAFHADCTVLLRTRDRMGNDEFSPYLNMLAAHDLVTSMLLNEDCDEVALTIDAVANLALPQCLCDAAATYRRTVGSRLAFIGYQDHAATALYAAQVAQDVAGVSAQAIIGEQFGENVCEFGGRLLTAVFFGGRDARANLSLRRLAAQLMASGSTVVIVGPAGITGTAEVEVAAAHSSAELAHGAIISNMFAAELARAVELDATPSTLAMADS
jgi:glutamine---fructose-6-phosphate transaminase (isomerizing)